MQMQLSHRGVMLGSLVQYSYETPWASAQLITLDTTIIPRYAAIDAFLRWNEALPDDLPIEEADAIFYQELAMRGLDAAFLDSFLGGWQVRMADGEIRKIRLPSFGADGWLTWRW